MNFLVSHITWKPLLKVGHVLFSNSIMITESKTEFFGRVQTSSISHPLLHVGHHPMDIPMSWLSRHPLYKG